MFVFLTPLFLFSILSLNALQSEIHLMTRIQNHLKIGDAATACLEAKEALIAHPQSQILWKSRIQALAALHDEHEMMRAWQSYIALFPHEKNSREMLEILAWEILEKGSLSPSPLHRMAALLGAFFGQDTKGVYIIHHALSDSNTHVRALAVKLSGHMRDKKLADSILALAASEKEWKVHMEALLAAGSMRIKESKPLLLSLLGKQEASKEQQAACIQSLVLLLDSIERKQLQQLVESDQTGLKLLACQIAIHLQSAKDSDLLIPLLNDRHSSVRLAALQTLGVLRIEESDCFNLQKTIFPLLQDPDPFVAIAAAWLLTVYNQGEASFFFEKWLTHPVQDVRVFATGALKATGKSGLALLNHILQNSSDIYVRLNAAIGLISQRQSVDQASLSISTAIKEKNSRWMEKESGIFSYIAPSTLQYGQSSLESPEGIDQMVSLNLLNLLAIVKYPKIQDAIKNFLQHNTWGISAAASSLLLTEGDETALELVEQLLKDDDKKVRLQAALVLAFLGKNPKSLATLEESYAKASREIKEKILEALGKIGDASSIPFLTEKLEDPSELLRIIAASSLVQCLYH